MRQYAAAKRLHPDALLFFRMGDFYELFFEDATIASRELQIQLTSRDRERSVPMCGVPYHAAEGYLARLLRKGYRIAICEQMEDPKLTKKIVRREVTRVLTPGTAIDSGLSAEQNNFLASLYLDEGVAAIALLDLSTGEFRTTEFTGAAAIEQAVDELTKTKPAELLYEAAHPLFNDAASAESLKALAGIRTKTAIDAYAFTAEYAIPLLERQLGTHSLDGFGLTGHGAAAIAAGAVLHYVRNTQQSELGHIDSIRFYERSECLQLDQVTVRNLELVDTLFSDGSAQATLFHALDCCCTPMGKRLLRSSLLRPLADRGEILRRYDAVESLCAELIIREKLRSALDGILDLERLLGRISLETAKPRDLLALAVSLRKLPTLRGALEGLTADLWRSNLDRLDALEDVQSRVESTIVAEPPVTLADGGVIQHGVHAELDELRAISHSGRESIAAIEQRERTRTGIQSLKVRFNSVFGYYIEITKSQLGNVPDDYQRKQTLVNAERFTTPELKDFESRILTAHERCIEIEKQLAEELRQFVLAAGGRIRKSGAAIAEIDLLTNFAHLAALRNYTRPSIEDRCVLEVIGGRHPVVECMMEDAGEGRFVANDLYLDASRDAGGPAILLVTGPNMGGKSTYLRQAALLVILAQLGCFVPARSLRFGIVDRIYTRIGASDNLARGRSTFMVEMTETATILNTATERSLILLDEMGRGTATFDGLSLAWAALEHLHAKIGARTLFATHYHELTLLADQLPRLKNVRVGVKETPQGIVFLHAIEAGPASKSYGIEVARLAGLPASVLQRARMVLKQHERSERHNVAVETEAPLQMTMFTPLSQTIVDRLESTDIDTLTPLQALNLLEQLKAEIRGLRDGKGSG
ncbi:DNA mismatch repair protein MutS [Acidisarcina polymorpha]|nr:DNA mismatch repair protein MutS [Acidisarcina polymorpha]